MRYGSRTINPPVSGIREMFELADQYDDVINLCIGESGFPTPRNVIEAGREGLLKGYTKYTPNAGVPALREALSEKLERENHIKADPQKQIIVTAGGVEAVLLAILATVDEGDEVLVPCPYWPDYPEQIRLAGGRIREVPTYEKDGFIPLADTIQKYITERTRVLILNSPNNPTGAVIPREELEKIRDLAVQYDLTVISDEPYERLVYDSRGHVSIGSLEGMGERTITANTFSKTYAMSGWRVGYACGPEKIIQAMILLKEQTSSSVNACAQYACIEALKNTDREVKEMVSQYRQHRDFMVSKLNECRRISCRKPEGAFYVFVNIQETGMTSYELAKKILKEVKVVVTPGTGFGKYGEGYIRISCGPSMEELERAANRLSAFFSGME